MYDVSFTGTWTTAKNPTRPGSAHFTDLVGATHNDSVSFFQTGTQASNGVENVAEIGFTSPFLSEIAAAQGAGTADLSINQFVSGGGKALHPSASP